MHVATTHWFGPTLLTWIMYPSEPVPIFTIILFEINLICPAYEMTVTNRCDLLQYLLQIIVPCGGVTVAHGGEVTEMSRAT